VEITMTDFRFLLGAATQAVHPASSFVFGAEHLVTLAASLAWPLAALIIAIAFRRPLAAFVSSLGGRMTKLSVFSVSFELTPASAAVPTPLLDDIRRAESPAEISDSRLAMLGQIERSEPADYALIDLGRGEEWLTSRLYVAAIMLRRMRGVNAFIFVAEEGGTKRRFVALADVEQLRWHLAWKFPALELAWISAQAATLGSVMPIPTSVQLAFTSDKGGLEPALARQITTHFIAALQQPAPPPSDVSEWTTFGKGGAERAVWVTRELLEQLLPATDFENWMPAFLDEPVGKRTRAVLRRQGEFVALVRDDRSFDSVIDRRAVLERAARDLAAEPEG